MPSWNGRYRRSMQIWTAPTCQGVFHSERCDFHDKLRRVAQVNLTPELNDGVILNITPLHQLVPWKEAAKMWDELQAGKYEWSSIGRQLLKS